MEDLFNEPIFSEGAVSDFLKTAGANAAGIDADKYKDAWDNKDFGGRAKLVDKSIQGVADVTKAADSILKTQHYSGKSIVARARNSVLQFPVYITQTMRPNEAQIISKLFERVYTTLVQAVLAQNPIISEDEANNLLFLKQFHTNLQESADLDVNVYYQPIDDIDQMMKESVLYEEVINSGLTVRFKYTSPKNCMDLIKENARLMNEPLTGFSYLKEVTKVEETERKQYRDCEVEDEHAEFERIARDIVGQNASQQKIDGVVDDIRAAVKAKGDDDKYQKAIEKLVVPYKADVSKMTDDQRKRYEEAIKRRKKAIDNIGLYSYRNGHWYLQSSTADKTKKIIRDSTVTPTVKAPTLLRDADIKKINGMLPYTMEASFIIKTGGQSREVKFIIGVKTVLHPIRVQDLAEDLPELVTGNMKKLQKVRYKTGEITWSDYMFNKKGLKADAAKRINYNKRWLNTLKRLSEYNKMKNTYLKNPIKMITGGSAPIPNGTLILSQADVTMLTDQTGIDLSKVVNAKKLARSIFLIGVVIVDSAAGSMRVLFPDSDTDWDVQSLATIDAEVSKTDNSPLLNEMRKLIAK